MHRDIKPANIILLASGSAKVADFGIARLETSTLTQAGSVLGTPSYMSPEQFMGQTVDGRSDIFSAGVVLYQFLTGERPFTGAFTTIMHKVLKENPPLPSELNVQVPMAFDAVVRKALAKRPDDRYQSAAEFRQAILAVQSGPSPAAEATLVASAVTAGAAGFGGGSANPPVPAGPAGADGSSPSPMVLSAAPKSHAGLFLGIAAAVVILVVGASYVVMQKRSQGSVESGAAASGAPPTSMAQAAAVAPPLSSSTPVAATGVVAPIAAAVTRAPAVDNGVATITAVGVVDPDDSRYQHDPQALQQAAIEDARRQLVEKAAALYVEQSSLDQNYAVLRDKLLAHSDQFIKAVLDQQKPVLNGSGLMSATLERQRQSARRAKKSQSDVH